MKPVEILRICETCPWLTKNHGKRHSPTWHRDHPDITGWYTKANLRRLWTGLRTGDALGMICHSSDPNSTAYGGREGIKPGKERACAGALTLIYSNINAFGEGQPQPFQPPMTKPAIAHYAWQQLVGQMPAIEDRRDEVSLPW